MPGRLQRELFMQIWIECIFWGCVAAVGYAYLAYPAVIFCLSRFFGRERAAESLRDDQVSFISLLIAAHNEEAVIEQRILNALAMDYPAAKLEIVIASDGSDDNTAAIVRRFSNRVRLLDYAQRRGKAATLNAAMQQVRGEIILLSDANTSIDPAAARKLVRWFADARVGAVCGKLVLVDPISGANVDSLYWRYETFLKRCEGRLGALLGSNGAIYAIRRESFVPIPPQTIVDDFCIPLLIKLRTNGSIVYDESAIAEEESAQHVREEFRRRVRIGAGGFQAIGMLWPLLDPRNGWIAFTFWSHKIMRWVCPFFLIGALACCAMLAIGFPIYRWALIVQIVFYAGATIVGFVPRLRVPRVLRLCPMFTSMNAALFLGFFRWLTGGQKGVWRRTERAVPLRQAA
jgi:cellulose synthase/poly-beta-1,6-N-acetylglucosamine synthase-like glycosyltransferase